MLRFKLNILLLLILNSTLLTQTLEKSAETESFADTMARANTPTALDAIEAIGGVEHLNDRGADRLEQVLTRFDKKPSSTIVERLYHKGLRAHHLLQINYTMGWSATIYQPIDRISNPIAMTYIRTRFGITERQVPLSKAELIARNNNDTGGTSYTTCE